MLIHIALYQLWVHANKTKQHKTKQTSLVSRGIKDVRGAWRRCAPRWSKSPTWQWRGRRWQPQSASWGQRYRWASIYIFVLSSNRNKIQTHCEPYFYPFFLFQISSCDLQWAGKMHVLSMQSPSIRPVPPKKEKEWFQTYEWPVGEMKNKQQWMRVSWMKRSRMAVNSLRRKDECWSLMYLIMGSQLQTEKQLVRFG